MFHMHTFVVAIGSLFILLLLFDVLYFGSRCDLLVGELFWFYVVAGMTS